MAPGAQLASVADLVPPHYAWCCVCDSPVVDVVSRVIQGQFVPTTRVSYRDHDRLHLELVPCGHQSGDEDVGGHLLSVGLVSTVGEGVGPLPSITIAGR